MRAKKFSENKEKEHSQMIEEDEIIQMESTDGINVPELAQQLFMEPKLNISFDNNQHLIQAIEMFSNSKTINILFVDARNEELSELFTKLYSSKTLSRVDSFSAFEVVNLEDKLRQCIFVKTKTKIDIYEGELTDIKIIKNESQDVQKIEITLKNQKGSKTIEVSKYLYNIVKTLNIGDIIYSEPGIGLIKRLGRSETQMNEYDLEGDKYIQLKRGSIYESKEKETYFTLYDIDYAFNNYCNDISSLCREQSNSILNEYLEMKIAMILESSIIIRDAEHLTDGDFSIINRYSELCNWIKFIIVADKRNLSKNCILNGILSVKMHDESPTDVLKTKNKITETTEFEDAIKKYLTNENISMIDDVLKISENPEDFVHIMNLQLK